MFKSSSMRKRNEKDILDLERVKRESFGRVRNSENSHKVSETQMTEGKEKVPSKILTS